MPELKFQSERRDAVTNRRLRATVLILFVISLSITGVLINLSFRASEVVGDTIAASEGNSQIGVAYSDQELEAEVDTTPEFQANYGKIDPRISVLDKYFEVNNSPLAGTGEIMIRKCIEYKAPQDCLIVAAIADAETDLCKYHTSATYYNCWGFGGGGSYRIYFDSWEQSIDRVYSTLAYSEIYGNDVMVNPVLMERTFCGWEPGCTGWGRRVIYYMDAIDQFAKDMGVKNGMYGFR